MTHYYDFYYKMPEYIEKIWKSDWYNKKVLEWTKTLKPRKCGIHGELSISIGWYGIRAQCLSCKKPDSEEIQIYA